MMTSLQMQAVFLWLVILPTSCSQGSPACQHDAECGWNSFCGRGQCGCIPNHVWSANQRDCVDVRCYESRCVDCSAGLDKCRRCTDFIEESTGQCLDSCPGSYMLVIEGARVGKVCPVAVRQSMMRVYVAIIIGVVAGIIMTSLSALCFYWHTRESKSKKLKPRAPTRDEIEVVQDGGHINKAFDNVYTANYHTANGHIDNGHIPNGTPRSIKSHSIHSTHSNHSSRSKTNGSITKRPTVAPPPPDLSIFLRLVCDLRVYIDTFLAMLREVKVRNTALPEGDNRSYVYKNVIHQLCRVLTILNTDDEYLEIPSDGVLLLRWADTILQKYLAIKDPEYWEPGSPVGTLTSTFKPDHRLIPNGETPGTASNSTFKYERYNPDDLDLDADEPEYRELSIHLDNDFTEPIEV